MSANKNEKRRLPVVASDVRTTLKEIHEESKSELVPTDSLHGLNHRETPLRSPKRYKTRAAASRISSSSSSKSNAPIRIRPPTFNLYFRRMHDLFFRSKDQKNDAEQEVFASCTSISPSVIKVGSIRLQSIYESPNIFVINQFLSPVDVKYFFTHLISKYKFQRSYVDDSEELIPMDSGGDERLAKKPSNIKNPYRTSTFLSLNKQHNSRIACLEEKVASLFGCSSMQIEALQIVRYQSPDQCFQVHHDLGVYNESTGQVELPNKSIWYQRRIITVFCYLNTVPPSCGGATYFPYCTDQNLQNPVFSNFRSCSKNVAKGSGGEIVEQVCPEGSIICDGDGLRVYPVAGRALVFSNVLSSGLPDPRTIHAGEPVSLPPNDASCYHDEMKGSKYGLNIWICES